MPFFRASDGVRLHYEIDGAGPPLVLHLGAGADADLWRAAGYVRPLSRSYTCVLFDHRGHGKSDHPTSAEANHIDRYANDVAVLADHLGYSRVAFFGWSNAIAVGLRAFDQHPELFTALVLFGSISRPSSQEEIAAATARRVAALRETGWHFILDPMIAAERSPIPQWFLDRVMATDIEPLIGYSAARTAWNWSPWNAALRVNVPTLLLAGALEDPEDLMAELASRMSNATRVRIPEREHINAFLASDLVVPPVMNFLAAHRAMPVA